VKVGICTI